MAFSTFSMLGNHHLYPVPKHFCHFKVELPTYKAVSPKGWQSEEGGPLPGQSALGCGLWTETEGCGLFSPLSLTGYVIWGSLLPLSESHMGRISSLFIIFSAYGSAIEMYTWTLTGGSKSILNSTLPTCSEAMYLLSALVCSSVKWVE